MPKFLTFACRGFALAVPMLALLAYYLYVSRTDGPDPTAKTERTATEECADAVPKGGDTAEQNVDRAGAKTAGECPGSVSGSNDHK